VLILLAKAAFDCGPEHPLGTNWTYCSFISSFRTNLPPASASKYRVLYSIRYELDMLLESTSFTARKVKELEERYSKGEKEITIDELNRESRHSFSVGRWFATEGPCSFAITVTERMLYDQRRGFTHFRFKDNPGCQTFGGRNICSSHGVDMLHLL
jgi:hypothetical protein